MPELLLIQPGRRQGRTLNNEALFRAKLAEGADVYTTLNGVFFRVSLSDAGDIAYTAMTGRPEGI